MAYFPMYVKIEDESCLIVGGGAIAFSKAVVLKDFGAKITLVAEDFCEELLQYAGDHPGSVRLLARSYENGDCEGRHLVVAATDSAKLNHEISHYCRMRRIPVNVVDCIGDCTFIFPSYVRQQDLVAAFSSSGKSPMLTQLLKEEAAGLLSPLYGELNECLGNLRPYVKKHFADEEAKKNAYRRIVSWTKEHGAVPNEEEAIKILTQQG